MKVELKVSVASNVVTMSNCPRNLEAQCDIMYRSY